jgi:tripartite-type tricarboxylate transporter receptor subunit TctC
MKAVLLVGLAVLVSAAVPDARSASYPTKPVRLVVPFPPGGGTDLLSRIFAVPLTETFGQPVIVDNRPGAGGSLGAEIVARAEPDGYTIILVSASYAASGAYHNLSFDPINGVHPIILIGTTGLALSVHPSVPAKSTADVIALAKASPGKLNYASVGPGSAVHLALELFKLTTKTNMVHVPYKGGGPALNALIAGEVQVSATSMVPTIPHAKAGKVRMLAITTGKRSPVLPDVPTIGETVPGYEVTHWYGVWGPKGMRKDIGERWNKEIAKILQTEELRKRTRSEGLELAGGPPQEFGAVLASSSPKARCGIPRASITSSICARTSSTGSCPERKKSWCAKRRKATAPRSICRAA